jgi:hypothetical protein
MSSSGSESSSDAMFFDDEVFNSVHTDDATSTANETRWVIQLIKHLLDC